MSETLRVQYFQCTESSNRRHGKWGFKIKEFKGGGWFNTHKTRYDFETRLEAVEAAKVYVNENHPGQWKELPKRRVRR
jgi:hypothetical protein